jgi:hypothetical protein
MVHYDKTLPGASQLETCALNLKLAVNFPGHDQSFHPLIHYLGHKNPELAKH